MSMANPDRPGLWLMGANEPVSHYIHPEVIQAAALAIARVETGDDGETFANDIDLIFARVALEAAASLAGARSECANVGDLDLLPNGTVIKTKQGFTLEKMSAGWYKPGAAYPYRRNKKWLPVTVLHRPDTFADRMAERSIEAVTHDSWKAKQ